MLKQMAPPRYQGGRGTPQSLSIKFFPQGRSITLEKTKTKQDEDAQVEEQKGLDSEVERMRKSLQDITAVLQKRVDTEVLRLDKILTLTLTLTLIGGAPLG